MPANLQHACGAWRLLGGLIVAGSVLAAGSLDAEAQRRRGGGKATPITFVEVKAERLNERIAAVGTSRARQQVTLTTRVAGVISKVLFEGGARVVAGQALVQLESELEQIAVETAEAQRSQAADAVARYKQLSEGTVSRVVRAEADTALKIADAALRRARKDLDRMTIKAPFAGIMGLSNLHTGDYIAVGTPIATIDDRSALMIEFTVPEAVASSVKKGLPVRANPISRSGEIYSGTVHAVDTRIDPVSRTLTVRAEIPNPELTLIPGSTFSVNVRLPGDEAAQVPSLAIQWDRVGAYVWRLDGDKVNRIDVAILARNGDRVLVDGTLKAGDKVVREGGGSLREGQSVRPQS